MTPPEPFLTSRFDSALRFASELHHTQFRKGTNIPYMAHLMSVAALVLEAGGNEDQAIAALLHDAMEDQGGRPTLNKIRELLGDRVANAVEECSDMKIDEERESVYQYDWFNIYPPSESDFTAAYKKHQNRSGGD